MIERSRRVVLLIDYDNLQICASRDTPGRELQLPPVVQLAQRYGTVILARAYAEWNLSTERLAVYKAGIEPAFAPVLRTESEKCLSLRRCYAGQPAYIHALIDPVGPQAQ